MAWVGYRLGGAESQGTNKSQGINIVSQVDGVSDMTPDCVGRGRAEQRNNGHCQYLSPGESSTSSPGPDGKQFSSSLSIPDAF